MTNLVLFGAEKAHFPVALATVGTLNHGGQIARVGLERVAVNVAALLAARSAQVGKFERRFEPVVHAGVLLSSRG